MKDKITKAQVNVRRRNAILKWYEENNLLISLMRYRHRKIVAIIKERYGDGPIPYNKHRRVRFKRIKDRNLTSDEWYTIIVALKTMSKTEIPRRLSSICHSLSCNGIGVSSEAIRKACRDTGIKFVDDTKGEHYAIESQKDCGLPEKPDVPAASQLFG